MQRQIRHGFDPHWLDDALQLYREAGLGHEDAAQLQAALVQSYRVVTCWNGEEFCGIGRLISDGSTTCPFSMWPCIPAISDKGLVVCS